MTKRTFILTASLLAMTAFAGVPENTIVHSGYDHTGAFVEEFVVLPEGASASDFASHLTENPPARVSEDIQDSRVGFRSHLSNGGYKFALTYTREFSDFSELFEPEYIWTIVEVADTGEAVVAPKPVERRGILSQVGYSFQERPVVSTLTTVGGILGLDYLKDGEINLFGLLGDSDDGSGGSGVSLNVGGDNNVINITENNSSLNDSSNRPATAAPFFPPSQAD